MSVKMRLARGGTKKRPVYKVVVADSRAPRDGRFIEAIGYYNPLLPKDHADALKIDAEKAKDWLKKGAEPSERVEKLLALLGLANKPEIKLTPKKSAPKAKAQERAKALAEKQAALEEAKKQEAENKEA